MRRNVPIAGSPRAWLMLLVLQLLATGAAREVRGAEVLVVKSSRLPAYEEAVEGLSKTISRQSVQMTVVTLDDADQRGNLRTLLARKPAVVVAVGSASVSAVLSANQGSRVVATMVLRPSSEAGADQASLTTVSLEIPPLEVMGRLKQLYPKRNRIALIRGPSLSAAQAVRIETLARSLGFAVRVFDCPGPRELLDALGSMQGNVDFVWCLPDSQLYQGPTVPAAILAALRRRVGVIGFSEGFVRAGALIGFYPDYRDIGRQAGEAALRHLQDLPSATIESPRKVTTAVNERVVRVLGIPPNPSAAEMVLLR